MGKILRNSLMLMFLFGFLLTLGCSEEQNQDLVITFSDSDEKLVLEKTEDNLAALLTTHQKNVDELKKKYVPSVDWNKQLSDTSEITMQCNCEVSLQIGGEESKTYKTTQSTVGEFLAEEKIPLTAWDELKPSPEEEITDKLEISIDQFETKVKKEVEEIPFEKEEEKDDELDEGKTKVKTEGKTGKKVFEVTHTYKNGELLKEDSEEENKRLVQEIKPENQIILVGTKKEEQVEETTATETQVPAGSRTLNVEATGYTHTGNPTATGTMPKRGTIAVDPRVIPLGTRIYVPGYGYGIAEDTGGVVRGNIIDLFFETRQEAINWGRRPVQIKILD